MFFPHSAIYIIIMYIPLQIAVYRAGTDLSGMSLRGAKRRGNLLRQLLDNISLKITRKRRNLIDWCIVDHHRWYREIATAAIAASQWHNFGTHFDYLNSPTNWNLKSSHKQNCRPNRAAVNVSEDIKSTLGELGSAQKEHRLQRGGVPISIAND